MQCVLLRCRRATARAQAHVLMLDGVSLIRLASWRARARARVCVVWCVDARGPTRATRFLLGASRCTAGGEAHRDQRRDGGGSGQRL